MSFEFALCLATLLFLAGIGTPIGHSTILAGLVYLAVGGQDIALAGEQALWGLYGSFVLLAVPLFIAAAKPSWAPSPPVKCHAAAITVRHAARPATALAE